MDEVKVWLLNIDQVWETLTFNKAVKHLVYLNHDVGHKSYVQHITG